MYYIYMIKTNNWGEHHSCIHVSAQYVTSSRECISVPWNFTSNSLSHKIHEMQPRSKRDMIYNYGHDPPQDIFSLNRSSTKSVNEEQFSYKEQNSRSTHT